MTKCHETSSAERAVQHLLRTIGRDPCREGLKETPGTVAKALDFFNSGASQTPLDSLKRAVLPDPNQDLILVRNITFHSLCERHLLPFHGRAHIAYLPAGRVIDSSRLPRLLEVFARRLQMTHRLTHQVAQAVQDAIQPRGVAVRLEAAHFCNVMRGIEKHQSLTLTSTFLGAFDRDIPLRLQFFSALQTAPSLPPLGRPAPDPAVSSTSAAGESARYPETLSVRAESFASDAPPVPRSRYSRRLAPPPELRGR